MRRLLSVVIATLVAVLLLAPATVAFADAGPAAEVAVLAAEGGGEEGPQGPSPMGPHDTENSNAPAEYEPPFLINAAVGLAALMILLVLGLGALYWLLVQRHRTTTGS